jgi:hypothetical protein
LPSRRRGKKSAATVSPGDGDAHRFQQQAGKEDPQTAGDPAKCRQSHAKQPSKIKGQPQHIARKKSSCSNRQSARHHPEVSRLIGQGIAANGFTDA